MIHILKQKEDELRNSSLALEMRGLSDEITGLYEKNATQHKIDPLIEQLEGKEVAFDFILSHWDISIKGNYSFEGNNFFFETEMVFTDKSGRRYHAFNHHKFGWIVDKDAEDYEMDDIDRKNISEIEGYLKEGDQK